MGDRESRRRYPIHHRFSTDYYDRSFGRNELLRDRFRNHCERIISPPRRVYRDYSDLERRDRVFRREFHERRYSERDNPEISRCLGIFGMSKYTKEDTLHDIFSRYGPIEKIKLIYDPKTNHSRGYSFIYFENIGDAVTAREHCSNLDINGKTVRVDFSLTNRAHSPTPGMYMGNQRLNDNGGRDGRRGGDRSPRYDTSYRGDSYRRDEGPERIPSRYQHYSRTRRF